MPRYEGSFPRRPAPSSPISELGRSAWTWLRPRLEEAGRASAARVARFVEGDEARTLAHSVVQWTRQAIRWAWRNDTVPADTVKNAVRNHEMRMEQAEKRRVQREMKRQQQEAKRKAREQRYAEKSSIYLG